MAGHMQRIAVDGESLTDEGLGIDGGDGGLEDRLPVPAPTGW